MTQEEMNILVPRRLREIEQTHQVKVLYAAESGSRAWGFASPDSDFDIRMIYMRSQSDYLRLDKVRDVIDYPVDGVWDISGWDLDKTLRLLYVSNPSLYDWLGSPVCYYDSGFKAQIEPLLKMYFSQSGMMRHYCGIAGHRIAEVHEGGTLRPKKYFYALRAVLCCRWIEKYDDAPPVPFTVLLDEMLPPGLRGQVDRVMQEKVNLAEKAQIERSAAIDDFLDAEYAAIREYVSRMPAEADKSWDELNRFFMTLTA